MSDFLTPGTTVQFRSRASFRLVNTAIVLEPLDTHTSRAFVSDHTASDPIPVRITAVSDFASDHPCATLPVDTTPAPGHCRPSPLPDNPVWLVAAGRLVPVPVSV